MSNEQATTRHPWRLIQATALASVLTLSAAWADSVPAKAPAADATKPNTVGDVVVRAPSRRHHPRIPPAKAAAFAADAARQEAWRKYRDSMPPASAGTLGQANDYPGLHSLIAH